MSTTSQRLDIARADRERSIQVREAFIKATEIQQGNCSTIQREQVIAIECQRLVVAAERLVQTLEGTECGAEIHMSSR